jgi:hypothetical protein
MKLPPLFSKNSLPYLLFFAAPLPFCIVLGLFYLKIQHFEDCQLRLELFEEKSSKFSTAKKNEELFLSKLKKAEKNYLERHLETLSFVSLRNGEENRLIFVEEPSRRTENFEECEVKLKHPVSLNEEELKQLLSLIEGVSIGRFSPEEASPQLLIKNFQLAKKMDGGEEESFEVKIDLIKRTSVN